MKTVIEMARSVGATTYTNRHYPDRPTHTFNVDQLEAFVELVRADERNRTWTQAHWTEYERSIAKQEQQRIVNLLMIQHEMAKGAHNYWHVAAQLIQADVASDT